MRFLYLICKTIFQYTMRVFYKDIAIVNDEPNFLGSTIYVSNHAASFMDPLIIASLKRPIVFFMTRSDVFTKLTKPLLWSVHMLPIYRQQDGENTAKKNEAVFGACSRVLKYGRNLLIFGEGFTDDKFVRRLKPVKKGAARIGFFTLEKHNWNKKIYIAAIGLNYTSPNKMRSDILIETSEKICLNDYREQYESNPVKVINELTKEIEIKMQECITHIENIEHTDFHEDIMSITRNGMNAENYDPAIPIIERRKNSQILAEFFNKNASKVNKEGDVLKQELSSFFKELKANKIKQNDIIEFEKCQKLSYLPELFHSILIFPIALLGIIHTIIPYKIVKPWVEKKLKREVFWGSVKSLMGTLAFGVFNLPVVYLIHHFIYPSWFIAWIYYLLIGVFFVASIKFKNLCKTISRKNKINSGELNKWVSVRNELLQKVDVFIGQ
ncbi:MAG: 1-acyl-sn-glycerol-3-phosphate acyltransferase [Lentimonas sp.]|jgi:1-acyl-sn-glycerol-3-phosphate acyltransferase